MLSTDQMRAVNAGLGTKSFEWVELPEGPQPLPVWLKGLHIDWMEKWSNSPLVTLKTDTNLRLWNNQVYRKEGARYISESGDGRAEQYAHDGALTWNAERGYWQTSQSEGFGGSCISIKLDDGRDVMLRGPWNAGTIPGFVEVSYVDMSEPWRRRQHTRPWYTLTPMAGLQISEDLFGRAIARFSPTCRLARVTFGGATTLDPVRWDWDLPKGFKRSAA